VLERERLRDILMKALYLICAMEAMRRRDGMPDVDQHEPTDGTAGLQITPTSILLNP